MWLSERKSYRERGRETIFLLWFIPYVAAMVRAGVGQSQEPYLGLPCGCRGPSTWSCLMLILRLIYSELGWLRAAGTGTRGLWMPTSQVAVLPSVPKCWPPTSVVLYQHQCQVNKLIIKILPEDFKFLSSAFKKRFESQMGREPGRGNKLWSVGSDDSDQAVLRAGGFMQAFYLGDKNPITWNTSTASKVPHRKPEADVGQM